MLMGYPQTDYIDFNSLHHTNLYDAFRYHALTSPNATALVCRHKNITYAELNFKAQHLATTLIKGGAEHNSIIPIFIERSEELVVSIIATLISGAAYAVIDPNWPEDRIMSIMKSLQPPVVIVNKTFEVLEGVNTVFPSDKIDEQPDIASTKIDADNSACIFFTSGTTGEPKGVVSTHAGTLRLFNFPTFGEFNNKTVISLASATPWDAFSLELWGALANGGTAIVIEEPYLSSQTLQKYVSDFGLNTIWMTSSLFNMTVEEDLDSFKGLCLVMVGGEKLSPKHVEKFLLHHPNIKLLNGYGPVESTVFATTHEITLDDCQSPSGIPLGSPVPKTEIYILNDKLERCSEQEVGQICISGLGLAKGYLHDPELTNKKFKTVPIQGKDVRIYCSGDLGYIDQGILYFKGRGDRQLKVRGHRVELAEVEAQVSKYLPEVTSCKVIPKYNSTSGFHELFAFCIPHNTNTPNSNALNVLKSAMVSYQCPSNIYFINSFPLTAQGKLDERKLLGLVSSDNKNEINLQKVSRQLTSTEKIISEYVIDFTGEVVAPIDTSYTQIGLSSLDLGRLCSRISKHLQIDLSIGDLYKHPTIFELSKFVEKSIEQGIKKTNIQHDSVMNFTQLMYLTQFLMNPVSLSSRCLLTWVIEGDLNIDRLEKAIELTHVSQKALCSSYSPETLSEADSKPSDPPKLVVLPSHPSKDEALQKVREELSKELDPTQGHTWRDTLCQIKDQNIYIFGCVIHHIAFDGYSEHVLSHMLSKFYNTPDSVSNLNQTTRLGYTQYTLSPPNADQSENDKAITNIASQLDEVPEIKWPQPLPHESGTVENQGHISCIISKSSIEEAKILIDEPGVTTFELLLHAWSISLNELTNQEKFSVGIPIRLASTVNHPKRVSCNINMVCPIFTKESLQKNRDGFLHTRKIVQSMLASQDIPFPQVLQSLKLTKHSSRTPVFQTLFALQDNPYPALHLEGLKTKFIRQPYLELPLELHAELWPLENQDLELVLSFKTDHVSSQNANTLLEIFIKNIDNLPHYLSQICSGTSRCIP